MEYITTQDLFEGGELNTILSTNCEEDSILKGFIEKYEPMILSKILGQKFYNELQVQLVGGLSGEWEVLVNGGGFVINGVTYQFRGLKYITAGFIFYWYHRNNHYNVAQTMGTIPLRKEAENKSMAFKQRQNWNESIDLTITGCDSLRSFLNNSDLEDYECNPYGKKINGVQWL